MHHCMELFLYWSLPFMPRAPNPITVFRENEQDLLLMSILDEKRESQRILLLPAQSQMAFTNLKNNIGEVFGNQVLNSAQLITKRTKDVCRSETGL